MRNIAVPVSYRSPALAGTGILPVYELAHDDVIKCNFIDSIRSLVNRRASHSTKALQAAVNNNPSTLTFDAWPFFHSVKKTELAWSATRRVLNRRTRGFADSYGHLISWDLNNFRLCADGCQQYKDSTRTFLAGRFGEGLANLFMYDKGYRYWDHLPSLIKRAKKARDGHHHSEQLRRAQLILKRWMRRPNESQPDFVHENGVRDVALMESKGSFLAPDDSSGGVARRLKKALDQLEYWDNYLIPRPTKSFAVASYLRELGDARDSFMAFVDPVAFFFFLDVDKPSPLPKDWIRRGNYGAWLIGMGLESAGEALRHGMSVSPTQITLPVIQLPQGAFAFTVELLLHDSAWSTPKLITTLNELRASPSLRPWWESITDLFANGAYQINGLRVEVLKSLQVPLSTPNDSSLIELDSLLDAGAVTGTSKVTSVVDGEGLFGSILPDGSLYGAMSFDHPQLRNPLFQSFLL